MTRGARAFVAVLVLFLLLNDWFDVDMSFSKKLKNAFLWF